VYPVLEPKVPLEPAAKVKAPFTVVATSDAI